MFDLTGKTALITGGARGIGREIALALAKAGADLAITSRTEEELQSTAEEAKALSRACMYEALDVRDEKAVQAFVDRVIRERGKIDILVNAAGLNVRKTFLELTMDDWNLVMDVNLKSMFTVCQAVLPHMVKQKYGKVINIASLSSEVGFHGMAAYCASKGGVKQLTKALAVEFAKDNICVNGIGPGYFHTKMTSPAFADPEKVEWMHYRTPMKRIGREGDLGGAAVFLAAPESDYMTGQILYIDGGWLSNA